MHRHLYARSSRLHSLASLFLVTSITLSIIPSIVFLPVPQVAEAQTAVKAFPSAEGFGANSVGGRGGRAIHVTNLNASGPGSLRACMEATGPRTCIFRVGGTIDMGQNRFWTTNPYLTIAGHTAPGDGIMYKGQLEFNNTHDVIIRYMRARPGENVPNPYTGRSLTFVQGYNLMVDHCSFGWATDDTTGTSHSTATTYQWCIFSEGLNVGTAYGSEPLYGKGGINYGSDPNSSRSYLHNLFANFEDRVPNSSGGNHQIVNNVMYNVRGSSNNNGVYAPVIAEFVNNLYLFEGPALAGRTNGNRIRNIGCGWNAATPCSGTRYDYQLNSNIYVKGNIHTKFRPDNTYPENALVQQGGEGLLTQWTTPHGFPAIPTLTDAFQAKTDVLAKAGVTKPKRDSIDLRAINDVKNKTGVLPGTPADVGGYPTYASAAPYPDADVDGMSDTWESSHGLNPSNQADGAQTSSNGYTHLENFLNELAGDTIPGSPYGGGSTDTTPPSAPGSLTATAVSSTQASLSWNASTDNVGVTGYRVERCTGSTCTNFTQVATPTGTTYNNTGLQANTAYRFRVRAADAAGNLSPYSNITSATTQSSGGSGDTTTGLVSRYTFDNTAQDSAGTNHGTLQNGPTYTTGKVGSAALSLNGVNQYVSVPDSTTLNQTGDTTVAFWAKFASVGDLDTIITKESTTSGTPTPWHVEMAGASPVYEWYHHTASGDWTGIVPFANYTVPTGSWNHVALIRTAASKTISLYVNGVFVQSGTWGSDNPQANTSPVFIGASGNLSSTRFVNGALDDVRLYSRALTTSDVEALVALGTASSGDTQTGLVSRYTFDNTAQDSAGTNHGTLVGNPMYTTGKLNQALHLDGVDDYANVPHATTLNPGTAFSVAAWFNADTLNTTTSAGDHLVLKGDWNQTNSYSLVFYNNELRCNLGQKWNTGLTYAASNFTPGQWYHAACIADSTGHKLYINGALVASNSQTISSVTTTNPLQIGRLNSNGGHFDGKLDDVRIYNRALAQADVGALYAEGAPPSFDFTLANSGNDTVTQGQSSNNTITATLSAGTAQAVSFSASGLPTGATASFSPTTCSPTCTTTLTITTSPSTPAGFSTITVTGTAGSITKTTNFTLTVNQQDTLSEGLVSRYTFDNTAQDSAGTNHGTLQNGRTYTTGKINQAINLDGVDDYVNLGAPSTFNFGTTQSFTIAAWIKTASPAYRRIWSKGANSWSAGSFLMTTDAGQLLGGVPSGTQAGSAAPLTTGAIVGDGQWHHVAMRVDQSGKMIQTYVDGVARTLAKFAGTCGTASGTALDYALCASANATSASQANIGRNADGNGEYFQGSLDDVRIYNRALTATEVTSLFNFTGSGGSDTTNPTNPANLQATAESSTQVALSWNASTDNIAVTGYILERCEGVSCTTFTQLAAPSGTAHSDSTAAANTSYSYRVKATDAAGNQSGYSNIATLTTPASLKFAQNDRVFVTNTDGSPLNVRSCAGTSCSIVGQQQAGARGTVLTGPTLANNMWWWEIDYDTTPNGWSAEDFLQELAPDTTAPSTPTNITSTGTSGSSIALSWSPATDPTVAGEETSGVASYEVFRNGTSVGTSNTTSFTDTTLSPLTTYTYTITAKDGANNTSAPSASFSQSTESSSVIAPPSATITVTLSTAEGALTRYTTDGSTPIESSTLYSAPFNVTDGTTVKARSFMQGATPSPVVTVLGSASTASGTLAVGSSVRTTAALNVRQIPSTSGTLLGSQAPGATGTITQGPTAADGYTWWFVDYASAPDGWSAGNWLVAN